MAILPSTIESLFGMGPVMAQRGAARHFWSFVSGRKILLAPFIGLVAGLAVLSVLSWSCSEKQPKLASGKVVYEFLTNAKNAEIATYNRERIRFGQDLTINKEKRAILFEHPNAEVQFNAVAIPRNAVLQFGIGLDPEVWEKGGDGVTFEITVVDEKSAKTLIFSEYIDPKANSRDRKWSDHRVDLKDFAGQTIAFIFATTPGPRGNSAFDWAVWSRPEIRLEAAER